MGLRIHGFWYQRPVGVDRKERRVGKFYETPPWTDEQMDTLVGDLSTVCRTLSRDYYLLYTKGYDRDGNNPRTGKFKNMAEFMKWVSAPDYDSLIEEAQREVAKLGFPKRRGVYAAMHGYSGDNTRIVILEPRDSPLGILEYPFRNKCEADFHQAWPLEHWLLQDLRENTEKLEEIVKKHQGDTSIQEKVR